MRVFVEAPTENRLMETEEILGRLLREPLLQE